MFRKGFTLMEILLVLLLIALVVSFAAPSYRAVQFKIRNVRAKTALKKLAEASRTFYQSSRGTAVLSSGFSGDGAYNIATNTATACNNIAASGIPPQGAVNSVTVDQLFVCSFLNWKDFQGIPYNFYVCNFRNQMARIIKIFVKILHLLPEMPIFMR